MSEISEWVRTIATAISPLLVVVGWAWVNRQNNLRETRKETRALVDRTLKALVDASDLGIKYHTATSPSTGENWRLVLAVDQIATHMKLLRERGLEMDKSDNAYLSLKKTLTGGDFGTSEWKAWPQDDSRWLDLSLACAELTGALESAYFANFESSTGVEEYWGQQWGQHEIPPRHMPF